MFCKHVRAKLSVLLVKKLLHYSLPSMEVSLLEKANLNQVVFVKPGVRV